MEPWLLNWTAFVARNTHSVIDGVSYDDGPEWFKAMWKLWLNTSDHGEQLKQQNEEYNTLSNEMKQFLDKLDQLCWENGYEIKPTHPVPEGEYATITITGNAETAKVLYIDGDGIGIGSDN
jgi:hypothetical protein